MLLILSSTHSISFLLWYSHLLNLCRSVSCTEASNLCNVRAMCTYFLKMAAHHSEGDDVYTTFLAQWHPTCTWFKTSECWLGLSWWCGGNPPSLFLNVFHCLVLPMPLATCHGVTFPSYISTCFWLKHSDSDSYWPKDITIIKGDNTDCMVTNMMDGRWRPRLTKTSGMH